ncbi:MAG: aminoglycoside phosphotransferase family protein [Flavobacteriales bacterium]
MKEEVTTYERMLSGRGSTTTALAISIFLRGTTDRSGMIDHLREQRHKAGSDLYHSVFLVQALCWEGRIPEAEEVVRDTLLRYADLSIEGLRDRITIRSSGARIIDSHFETYSGSPMQNLGFFEHALEEPTTGRTYSLVTKLATREYAGREPLFFSEVYAPGTALAAIVPRPVDMFTPAGSELSIMTMEKVPGTELVVQAMTGSEVDRFIGVYRAVHDIGHEQVEHLFQNVPFEIAHSHAYLASAMHMSHDPGHFAAMNAWLLASVRDRGYSTGVQQLVERMVQALERAAFHRRIVPARHYGLLHGDMHRFNVLRDGDAFRIIDWGRCTTGPKGIDLAVLFRRFPYERTVAALERAGWWSGWPVENRILFAYSLVLVSVMIDLQGIKDEQPAQLFAPATRAVIDQL